MELNKYLLQQDVQNFIRRHLNDDITTLILKGSPFEQVPIQEIAQQIQGVKKLKSKAPSYYKDGALLPPKLNIEQSSSEQTALYKQRFLQQDDSWIDCTGGFGIDTFFMSSKADKTTYCEQNKELYEIVHHNFNIHQKKIETYCTNGIDFVLNNETIYDVIYIDPSRRTAKGKVISLEESEPNLLLVWNELLEQCNRLLVKLSPMLDINYLLRELSNIKEIHVISVKNDVKELLLLADKQFTSEPKLIATEISETAFSYNGNREEQPNVAEINEQKYIYEPFGALLKTNLNDAYANELQLKKVAYKSNFYLSNELLFSPLWKTFRIVEAFPFHKKELKKRIKKEPIQVVCRNFPLQPEQVQKLLGVKHGGNRFLLCTQAQNQQKMCFIVQRLFN